MDELIRELLSTEEPPVQFPPAGDFHSKNTVTFLGYEICKKTYFTDKIAYKGMRFIGKTAGLALVYGSSWKMFLGIIENPTEAKAKNLYNTFFNTLKVLAAYINRNIRDAKKNGFVVTLLNRRLYVDTLNSDNPKLRFKGERQVKNLPIQGAGSEIVKYILVRLYKFIAETKANRWYGLQPHAERYTRIIAINTQPSEELIERLESLPNGNCLVVALNEQGEPHRTFDRPLQLDMGTITEFNLEVIL